MVITWCGDGCFKIQAGDLTLAADPRRESRGRADVVLRTLTPWPISPISPMGSIDGPGQYEIKGAVIEGWLLEKESTSKFLKTVYLVEINDIKMGFLGHLSEELPAGTAEKFNDLDVLFLAAGGRPYLEPADAAQLARQLKPKVIIPGFFKDRPTGFLKEFNQSGLKAEEKFTFKKKDLADAKLRVVLLTM